MAEGRSRPLDIRWQITCRCGTELDAHLIKQSKHGRGRLSAECTKCGRLFRKAVDQRIPRVNASAESIVGLQIGPPSSISTRRAGSFDAYRVAGMPYGSTANLIRIRDRWTFVIHTQRRSIHGEWFSKNKENALEDLRDWLRAQK